MSRRSTLSLVLASLLVASAAHAQTVRGTVSEEGSGEPVAGAFVALLDAAEARRAGALTDSAGRYRIEAPEPGAYRVRVERIGYRSTTTEPIRLAEGTTVERTIIAPGTAIQLAGITATAERRCHARPGGAVETERVWTEARKALQANAWTEEEGIFRYRVMRYVRRLDDEGRIESERRSSRSGYFEKPFTSRPVEELVEHGFVQRTDDGEYYFAPDAEVLLSDPFLDSHCFRLEEGSDETGKLVGLAFEPVPDRTLPEVSGTLWLDAETAELRHLDYRFVNLSLDVPTGGLGGRIDFEQLSTGAWIVRHWTLRTPRIGLQQDRWSDGGRRRVLIGLKEDAGEVVSIREPGAAADAAGDEAADRALLTGVVYDSTRSAPLADAEVFLSGTSYAARTDAEGRFEIAATRGGTYSAGFTHPRLDSLGLLPPMRDITIERGDTASISLATPSMATLLAAGCDSVSEDRRDRYPSTLVGTVRDAATGTPLPGARVVLRWNDYEVIRTDGARRFLEQVREMRLTTDGAGRYRACAVPDDITIRITAQTLEQESDSATIRLAADDIGRRDLRVGLTAPATVVGRIVDDMDGAPVDGARVRLLGADLETVVTDGTGRFRFEDVTAGDYPIEVDHIAYGTQTDSLAVPAEQTVEVTFRLAEHAIVLDSLDVNVLSRRELEWRKRGTPPRLLTREEIEPLLSGSQHVGDVVRRLPGLTIQESGVGDVQLHPGVCIESMRRMRSQRTARTCEMVTVYIDDVLIPDARERLVYFPIEDIESIEFLAPSEAGVRYGTGSDKGVLLIYTRGNGPWADPK